LLHHSRERFGHFANFLFVSGLSPFDTLKKNILFSISVLVGVEYVPTRFIDPTGNFGHQARAIRSMDERDIETGFIYDQFVFSGKQGEQVGVMNFPV
jgi:hypothetical protein